MGVGIPSSEPCHAPSDLPASTGYQCDLPRASSGCNRLRGRRDSIEQSAAVRADHLASGDPVPVARYGTPGTSELVDAIEPLVQSHDAILMANHGVVTYGPDLLTAFFPNGKTTEHFASGPRS